MTKEFEYLTHAVACAARGVRMQKSDAELDWERVMRLAREQSAAFLLAYLLRKDKTMGCPPEIRAEWSSRLFQTVITANKQRKNMLRLLADMERDGFHPVLLKGYAAAACYAVPDSRISSDVDILIPPKEEARACGWLRKKDFELFPRWTDGHHSVCTHPDYGRVELHVALFDRMVTEVWFHEFREPLYDPKTLIRMETEDGSFVTLGHTDHLLFMTLHMAKHFINGGMTLRMMLDAALYMTKHAPEIDFARYWQVLTVLRYRELVNAALWAMIRYGGFTEADFPGLDAENAEQVNLLLSDVERSGWLGANTPDESRESHLAYSEYMQQKAGFSRSARLKRKLGNGIRRIFPARVVLMRYCPDAAERWQLLPLAWGKHLLHGVKTVAKAQNMKTAPAQSEGVREPCSRVSLLKRLGVM